ncbi:MAG: hypothetical protein FWG41_05070 [Methanomassiliicoccaceae archaeon]|nr:hypothetical protein [Methanomassiliicoccaceae archaeon]
MDDDYRDIPRNPVGYAILSLFCGVIGTVIVFRFSELSVASVVLGAVGMVIGGFAISLANHFPTKDRLQYIWLAGTGIMASVICFMFGFVNWLG